MEITEKNLRDVLIALLLLLLAGVMLEINMDIGAMLIATVCVALGGIWVADGLRNRKSRPSEEPAREKEPKAPRDGKRIKLALIALTAVLVGVGLIYACALGLRAFRDMAVKEALAEAEIARATNLVDRADKAVREAHRLSGIAQGLNTAEAEMGVSTNATLAPRACKGKAPAGLAADMEPELLVEHTVVRCADGTLETCLGWSTHTVKGRTGILFKDCRPTRVK